MEDIIRLRRAMGAVVFQWVRGHGGVHCNAYADMIAKACLDEAVADDVGTQRATAVRYEMCCTPTRRHYQSYGDTRALAPSLELWTRSESVVSPPTQLPDG